MIIQESIILTAISDIIKAQNIELETRIRVKAPYISTLVQTAHNNTTPISMNATFISHDYLNQRILLVKTESEARIKIPSRLFVFLL